jgi:hypothetical protein
MAGSVEATGDLPAPDVPGRDPVAVRVLPHPCRHFGRLHSAWIFHWNKRFPAPFVSVPVDDPNDNETSDDPNDDDDLWDDLTADDDTDGPIITCIPDVVLYLMASSTSAVAGTAPSPSPFPTRQRLRC